VPDAFPTFSGFFQHATGKPDPPYPYQMRLATDGLPDLLDIPTGLGKTAAVVLAWLWRRRFADPAIRRATPRRLVYCLPMRVLVEQTQNFCARCIGNLRLPDVHVHLLMGGEDAEDWDERPEHDAILIGTQDMLLSRALNRGYGASRYRWPMHFALLNNHCQWVLDETQLMGVGVETSAQLDAFRSRILGTRGPASTLWMSATLAREQLETVDHRPPAGGWRVQKLEPDDDATEGVKQRVQARKTVEMLPLALSPETKKEYAAAFAATILRRHKQGSLTLAVVNRVARAQDIFRRLLESGRSAGNTALVHSRFRPADRARQEEILRRDGDRIVVATQAVEAGVDVSAATLIVELAPWASMVQRFGRCNRHGEFQEGTVLWVDIATEQTADLSRPYEPEALREARSALEKLADAGPRSLPALAPPAVVRPVLRRKDLLDLFDTTPDLCGNDLDVSRYIRDGQDSDVQVFWRDFAGGSPAKNLSPPAHAELCSVSIDGFRDFMKGLTKRGGQAWRWNPLEEIWEATGDPRPGQVYLLERAQGGYSDECGWTGDPKQVPSVAAVSPCENDAVGRDKDTFIGRAVELSVHLDDVAREAGALAGVCVGEAELAPVIRAARWHDVGKAHTEFQAMLRSADPELSADQLWAKSASQGGHCERTGFRHELASALAWLQLAPDDDPDRDLVAYLIAAHHGKVRLSIRSWPNEDEPKDPNISFFARGVWDGDVLPAVALGDGAVTPPVRLDLSVMRLGDGPCGESWLARMLRLRDDPELGPFRLAFLETLLRVADWRATKLERGSR
jgi:CRISPR-associated endonuclease/helicase Cas3